MSNAKCRTATNQTPRTSAASEPRERSAPAKRRARERVGESEGRSPSDKTSDAVELRDGLRERLELSDEREHSALLLIDRLGAFEHLRRAFLRHHHDTVLVGHDDVAGTDGDAGALDGNVPGHGGIVTDRGTGRLRPRIDGQAHAPHVPEIAN